MKQVHFQNLDLNLLRVFDALYEEGSVTLAGRRLGLTQSAVSHALNRLRAALQDELFVRGPGGMTPTARAAQVWPDVRRGLDQLQSALARPEFVPGETDRRFNIAAPPAAATVFLPAIVKRIRELAPHAQLRFQRLRADTPARLEAGAVDVAIGAFPRLPDTFQRQLLTEETLVWVVRNSHPAARAPLTVEVLSRLPLLMIAIGEDARPTGPERRVLIDDGGAWERALGGGSGRRQIAVTVDDVGAALAMVAADDLCALLPRRAVEDLATARRLTLLEPPYQAPALAIELLWRDGAEQDPGIQWLLDTIRQSMPA